VSKSKAAYIAEPNFGKKAQLMMMAAQKKEKKTGCWGGRTKYLKKAVKSYDTYIRCMAVHLFKETDHRDMQQMISVCSNARAIVNYKKSIVARIIRKERSYKQKPLCCPAMLTPVQWSGWLQMCSSAGPIEYYLQIMGLVRYVTVLEERLSVAAASKNAISITNNNTNTNTAPSISMTGPTTTINPTISTNPTLTSNPTTNVNTTHPTNTHTKHVDDNTSSWPMFATAPPTRPAFA
jgi:hypothetical protein